MKTKPLSGRFPLLYIRKSTNLRKRSQARNKIRLFLTSNFKWSLFIVPRMTYFNLFGVIFRKLLIEARIVYTRNTRVLTISQFLEAVFAEKPILIIHYLDNILERFIYNRLRLFIRFTPSIKSLLVV